MNVFIDNTSSDRYGTLKCPKCGDEYLHQFRVEVFDRSEDSLTGAKAVVESGATTVSASMVGNPSRSRDGVRIHFDCETCGATYPLAIAQHKGQTLVSWENL
jgi:hypothetical protein